MLAISLEKAIRKTLGQKSAGEGLLQKLLTKLEKAQKPDGSWGWWPGDTGSLWISLHVLEAIRSAQPREERPPALEKGIRYLVNRLSGMEPREQLLTLNFLASIQQPLDYAPFLEAIDSLPLRLHDRLLVTRIRQRANLPYQLDTLDRYRRHTLYGATYYWEQSPEYGYYRFFHQPIATTLIAYEILKKAGRREEARSIQQYFLENRGIGQPNGRVAWYNTFETARVLAAILPDILQDDRTFRKNRIILDSLVLDSFPLATQISSTQALRLRKEGATPLYFTAYQQYHNQQPEAKIDVFRLSSRMIQNEREVESLTQGQTAILEVTLATDADAEYVMLEIPIPAGCSYAERDPPRQRLENHREYRREKAVIYCREVPAGTHTFQLKLEARFSGRFTLNPARAEQMYFPVLYGQNTIKPIVIR